MKRAILSSLIVVVSASALGLALWIGKLYFEGPTVTLNEGVVQARFMANQDLQMQALTPAERHEKLERNLEKARRSLLKFAENQR